MKSALTINLLLVYVSAVADYAALPLFVKKYTRPECDPKRILKFGRAAIALLVGFYTLISLGCYSKGWLWPAAVFSVYLLGDIAMSVRTLIKSRNR